MHAFSVFDADLVREIRALEAEEGVSISAWLEDRIRQIARRRKT
jgi:hypothetical protein